MRVENLEQAMPAHFIPSARKYVREVSSKANKTKKDDEMLFSNSVHIDSVIDSILDGLNDSWNDVNASLLLQPNSQSRNAEPIKKPVDRCLSDQLSEKKNASDDRESLRRLVVTSHINSKKECCESQYVSQSNICLSIEQETQQLSHVVNRVDERCLSSLLRERAAGARNPSPVEQKHESECYSDVEEPSPNNNDFQFLDHCLDEWRRRTFHVRHVHKRPKSRQNTKKSRCTNAPEISHLQMLIKPEAMRISDIIYPLLSLENNLGGHKSLDGSQSKIIPSNLQQLPKVNNDIAYKTVTEECVVK